jgi:o-succinylbenzoate synthase
VILTALTAEIVHIPLKTPFVTALRRVETVESVRVTLVSASGMVGVGEAPPTKAITGEDSVSIFAALEKIRPTLLQSKFGTIDDAMETLHGTLKGNNSAKAAVDMALYDLFAKEAGVPLYAYLGGSPGTIRSDVTISLNDPAEMAEDTRKAVRNGYDILKVKLGGRDGRDAERLEAVRSAAGAAALLLVDANQAWSEEESLRFIERTAHLDIALIEQPLPADALEGMRRLTARSPVPILADESAFDLEGARRVIASEAAHMINIKLMKCGGIHRAREILDYCRENGVSCMIGSMLEGPVSIAAALHLALAYPETIRWHDLDSPLLYRELPPSSPLRIEGNRITPTNGAGI